MEEQNESGVRGLILQGLVLCTGVGAAQLKFGSHPWQEGDVPGLCESVLFLSISVLMKCRARIAAGDLNGTGTRHSDTGTLDYIPSSAKCYSCPHKKFSCVSHVIRV